MKTPDDSIWDPATPPSEKTPDLVELEALLAPARWSGELPELPHHAPASAPPPRPTPTTTRRPSARPSRTPLVSPAAWACLAAAAAVIAVMVWWPSPLGPGSGAKKPQQLARLGSPYTLQHVAGQLLVGPSDSSTGGTKPPGAPASPGLQPWPASGKSTAASLAVGERITTGPGGRAVLHIDGLGTLELEADTALAILDPAVDGASDDFDAPAASLLSLERGAVEAVILASPGAFQVFTPAGLSVDLGCIYRAEVTESGTTRLSVSTGRVAFEGAGRRVFVPAGSAIEAEPGGAPSTPLRTDASARLRTLVAQADRDGDLDPDATASLLNAATPSDAITLLHLLHLPSAGPELFEHLRALEPLPRDTTREAALAGDPAAIESWSWRL
ncbi:MAG: hypothetical protein P1V81_06420 [Planctomycetota bacterium]|nr:hypothetical protein [Planctomycetota bacterium]